MTIAGDALDIDPRHAVDLSEFIALLGNLRIQCGGPSYRTLAKRVGLLMRPPQTVSQSTIGDVFQPRRRRLDLDLVVAVVRALGLDEAAVGEWRAACVRVHAEAKGGGPTGVFRQLPADLTTFTGRADEVRRLLATFDTPHTPHTPQVMISTIGGMPGVGKTQLAIHVAYRLLAAGRFTEIQFYVNLRGFDPDREPVEPAAVLEVFLRQLGVEPQRIPGPLEERAAMFRDRMHGREALLLLDNAADEAQVRDLIPAAPGCLVLITSRRSLAGLDGARWHRIDVFTAEEALALLAAIAGEARVAAEPEAAAELVAAVGRLPLAVSLVGARLRARPLWTLADVLRRLRAEGLDAVRAGDRALRPVFTLSYDGLTEIDRAVFRGVGVHPGSDYSAASLAAAAGVTVEEAEDSLEVLVHEHLLQERVSGRFEAHDLVRAFAIDVAAEQPDAVRAAAAERLAAWYLWSAYAAAVAIKTFNLPEMGPAHPGVKPLAFESYDEALAWFDAERDNLHAVHRAAAAAGLTGIAWRMPAVLKLFMTLRHQWSDYLASHLLGVEAARSAGEQKALGFVLLGAGTAYRSLDRLSEAEQVLDESARLYRELGDQRHEAMALGELAYLYRLQGRLAESIETHLRALGLDERLGDRRGAMVTRLNLAGAYDDSGRPDLAREMCRLALADAREVGDGRAVCIITGNIAQLHYQAGEFEEAHAAYAEARRSSQEIGDIRQRGQSIAGIGNSLHALNRTAEARPYWEEALGLFEEIGSDQAGEMRELLARTRGVGVAGAAA